MLFGKLSVMSSTTCRDDEHVALFANDTAALQVIHERLAARGASDSAVVETGGVVQTVRSRDPDGRLLEVSAYVS